MDPLNFIKLGQQPKDIINRKALTLMRTSVQLSSQLQFRQSWLLVFPKAIQHMDVHNIFMVLLTLMFTCNNFHALLIITFFSCMQTSQISLYLKNHHMHDLISYINSCGISDFTIVKLTLHFLYIHSQLFASIFTVYVDDTLSQVMIFLCDPVACSSQQKVLYSRFGSYELLSQY